MNFIRSRALKHRQFKEFLDELDSEYGDLVYFCEVRWLSRGKCLKRFFDLREEVQIFMDNLGKPVAEMSNLEWIRDLAFLTDICIFMNILNSTMQGEDILISSSWNAVKSFKLKLMLWEQQLRNGNLAHFPNLKETASANGQNLTYTKYADELKKLHGEFSARFQDFAKYEKDFKFFESPFTVDVSEVPVQMQLELIDLQCDENLKAIFERCDDKIDFYKRFITVDKYPNIRRFGAKIISLFSSSYLCESFFSKMKYTKNKYRNSLTNENLKNQLRVAVSRKIEANIEKLTKKKEHQISH